ncbi:MAG: hypothetical protein HY699_24870 [Deltaproteobacteria bacterium]|nr:hypothetical protein [Deltaproteobacteria bacterium]
MRYGFVVVVSFAGLLLQPAAAEVTEGQARALAQAAAPVSEAAGSVRRGSLSVHEGSVGSMHSRPVRDGRGRSMHSGPVSELGAGSVYDSVGAGGAAGELSVGAVKKDRAAPLGAPISQPLRELGALQEQLRAIEPVPLDAVSSEPPVAEELSETALDEFDEQPQGPGAALLPDEIVEPARQNEEAGSDITAESAEAVAGEPAADDGGD